MQKQSDLWVVKPSEKSNEKDKTRPIPFHSPHWSNLVLRIYKPVGLLILAVLFIVAGLRFGHTSSGHAVTGQKQATATAHTVTESSSSGYSALAKDKLGASEQPLITVDVHGDVIHPGLVKVPSDARVADVIKVSGGFAHKGDAALINQAALVFDGEEIDVPALGHAPSTNHIDGQATSTPLTMAKAGDTSNSNDSALNATSVASSSISTTRIDLNTADAATLETLPDMGPKRANEIIQYRQAHGPFISVNDLLKIRGIGTKTLAKWAPSLYVDQTVNHSKLS